MAYDIDGGIQKQSVELVHPGDIHVNGDIDDHSFVHLVSNGGSIVVAGKIDGNSEVILVSTTGSVAVGGKIDQNSRVTIDAAADVNLGAQGEEEGDRKIDGDSSVQVAAGGDILLGSYIHKAKVDFKAHGKIHVTEIADNAVVRHLADGEVRVDGRIDDSRVDLVSNRGSVTIGGKIGGGSKVSLTAGGDIPIGFGSLDGDHQIDGDSFVSATAGGRIRIRDGIAGERTTVDLAATDSIEIGKSISGGAQVRLLSAATKITIKGGIIDSGTEVISYPPGALEPKVIGATHVEKEWAAPGALPQNSARSGHWWENWPQTFGYVVPARVVPRSIDDIVKAVQGHLRVKAVGGGWSFTDAALPLDTKAKVEQASLLLRGAPQRQDMRKVQEGINNEYPQPMDLHPQAVGRNVAFSTAFDQEKLRQVTRSGAQLPTFENQRVCLIDTRSLASTLHCEFSGIRSERAPAGLFHVEAGITMADLQQLLDHQNPRRALRASGGSPGATLAGALSTATHGGEHRWPLLADTVKAVHLVGPGGEQWWIEGRIPVADPIKLLQRYPEIDDDHFIGGAWNKIPHLTCEDVLRAVIVSMGTMGVIYSVVLEVVPQFGLRQVVHPTTWNQVLAAAGTTRQALRDGDVTANIAVLGVLLDGAVNGTGIAKDDNVYVDLAINPLNEDCWVVNRQVTPALPEDSNNRPPGISDFATALSRALARHAVDTAFNARFPARALDFLSYAKDMPANLADTQNNFAQAGRLMDFLAGLGDVLGGTMAIASVQAIVNTVNQYESYDRGIQFLADGLTGFFHALMGTAPGRNSDQTGISHEVGAIGWPDGGLPGRGLEIAMDPRSAFSFLQKVVFDDILFPAQGAPVKPLIGYISIRVCPRTRALLGMQQFLPFSIMIEVVGYRSPQANEIMDRIQRKALEFSPAEGLKPLLHWGLENDQVTSESLAGTPLGQPYTGGMTRLGVFKTIREYLRNGHAPVFDNHFSSRLML